jgi:hypothetical protein
MPEVQFHYKHAQPCPKTKEAYTENAYKSARETNTTNILCPSEVCSVSIIE